MKVTLREEYILVLHSTLKSLILCSFRNCAITIWLLPSKS